MKHFLTLVLLLWCSHVIAETKIITSHALAKRGEPKYKEGFTHFDYVNPDAPKGGMVTWAARGSFDNFHRAAKRGVSVVGANSFNATLMVDNDDELDVLYGYIAEKVEYPEDHKWIIFHINSKAQFHDGKPITAEDAVFSFNKWMKEGVEQFRQYYANVDKVEALDKLRVRYTLKEGDFNILMALANSTVIPKHIWEGVDLGEPQTTPGIGSGPFKVKDFKMGQYVVWERIKGHWAENLPTFKGLNNFDIVRYDYYRDTTVQLEAFKAGAFDVRQEGTAKYWNNLYTGPYFDKNYIVKKEIDHDVPQGMQSYIYNVQSPFFKDIRVREALIHSMDFKWLNKNLFFDQYTRTRSFFQNSEYEAKGLPSPEELKILEPLRDKIPARVFTEEYNPPVTEVAGKTRKSVRAALKLLKEAGWEIKDKVLTHKETGKVFDFEVMIYSPSMERILIPMQKVMKRMGITMNIRLVDATQFTYRGREGKYDMISRLERPNYYPDQGLKIRWRSDYLEHSYNSQRIQDPGIDALIDGIVEHQQDPEALVHYGRAFDRVLQWNFLGIPQWHYNKYRLAYWNKFSFPDKRPKYSLGLATWWYDEKKAAKLPDIGSKN